MIVLARWIALVLFWLLIWWELHTDRACGASLAILTSLQDNGTLLIAKQEPRRVSNHKQQQKAMMVGSNQVGLAILALWTN